jgi:hypothetical protein
MYLTMLTPVAQRPFRHMINNTILMFLRDKLQGPLSAAVLVLFSIPNAWRGPSSRSRRRPHASTSGLLTAIILRMLDESGNRRIKYKSKQAPSSLSQVVSRRATVRTWVVGERERAPGELILHPTLARAVVAQDPTPDATSTLHTRYHYHSSPPKPLHAVQPRA